MYIILQALASMFWEWVLPTFKIIENTRFDFLKREQGRYLFRYSFTGSTSGENETCQAGGLDLPDSDVGFALYFSIYLFRL